MDNSFVITVEDQGKPREFPARLLLQGYAHKIQVKIDDQDVIFEPDEEGHYRAVQMPWQNSKDLERIDRQLLGMIREQIQALLA